MGIVNKFLRLFRKGRSRSKVQLTFRIHYINRATCDLCGYYGEVGLYNLERKIKSSASKSVYICRWCSMDRQA